MSAFVLQRHKHVKMLLELLPGYLCSVLEQYDMRYRSAQYGEWLMPLGVTEF